MAAFWMSAALLLFGCTFLFDQLIGVASMRHAIGGASFLSVELSPAFLVAALLFVGGTAAIFIWQQKPKVADLLIDTESELRKVTWPTLDEVMNSSTIVVFFVLFLGAFLALADVLLTRIVRVILWGGGA